MESLFFVHLYVGSRDQAQVTGLAWHLHVLSYPAHPPLLLSQALSLGSGFGRLGWLASAKRVHPSASAIPVLVVITSTHMSSLLCGFWKSNDFRASTSLTDGASYPSQGLAMDNTLIKFK